MERLTVQIGERDEDFVVRLERVESKIDSVRSTPVGKRRPRSSVKKHNELKVRSLQSSESSAS